MGLFQSEFRRQVMEEQVDPGRVTCTKFVGPTTIAQSLLFRQRR